MAKLKQYHEPAISIGAGAVYPYSDWLVKDCARESRFGDKYNLAKVISAGDKSRILLPRNMALSCVEDFRTDGKPAVFESAFKARNDEQERLVSESVQLLAQGHSFMVEAPTGFGKTICATEIIARTGKKTLVIGTKEDIRDQWLDAFDKVLGLRVGAGVGLIQGDTCSVAGAKVVFAMIQSLSKEGRYPESVFRDFGLVVWDEVHRVGADHFSQSAFRIPAKLRLGISATPDRKDGREEVLLAHIGPVMVKTEMAPMTPRIIAQRSPWEIPYKRKMQADRTIKMVQLPHSAGRCGHVTKLLANHHPRNMKMVAFTGAAYKKGRTTLILSDFKDHLEVLHSLLITQGIPQADIGMYVGGMSESARRAAKAKRVILATYAMTAEATDIPGADTLVMATPKSDVRQIVGRVIRFVDGKKEPVVFDLLDITSSVFNGYWGSRRKWYESIGATVDLKLD